MKEQKKIPVGKVKRAAKFIKTGTKVGVNYAGYYLKKTVSNPKKEDLDKKNAEDIYGAFSELKGSALKVAQVMSMDTNILPKEYSDQFALAQYSAPPLSYPLVKNTFVKTIGKTPDKIFDTFDKKAVNAASIGQVHKASLGEKKLAVKVQYPGVAESIQSDLKIVLPIARRFLKLSKKEIEKYAYEIESKLMEEANYDLELERSQWITKQCSELDKTIFPKYYEDLSSKRVLTMDWIEGVHLKEFIEKQNGTAVANEIGQRLWDFYVFQIQKLEMVHADPHPGNFLVTKNNELGVIDFGCVKELPKDFYRDYFLMFESIRMDQREDIEEIMERLEFFLPEDSSKERTKVQAIFCTLMELVMEPFKEGEFDFSNEEYFKQIYAYGETLSKDKEVKNMGSARGSKHFIYMNRTLFGLFNILHALKAKNIRTDGFTGIVQGIQKKRA
jgi:predicted unusual protein kinase regulating ubiquinone biosynthesis (AarF/ABC1/UbiB family)